MKLTTQQAIDAIAQQKNNKFLNATDVANLLQKASVTFAQITTVTKVLLSAANKEENIQKVTTANVILCSNIKAHTSVYANKVKRSAAKYSTNSAAAVEAFTAAETYFEHTACHSIVQHKVHADKFYLYAIYNNASSVYMHNNAVVDKQHVAQYCTPSAAKALLQQSNTVHNVTNDITHDVQVRVIALSNVVSIKARKQFITV
jgi:hypothetical protein